MDKIFYSIENEVAQIMLDDGKANAMNWDFFKEMGKCIDMAEDDPAKVLVITGRPGFFSGGLDLKLLPTLSNSELTEFRTTFARTMLRVFSFPDTNNSSSYRPRGCRGRYADFCMRSSIFR